MNREKLIGSNLVPVGSWTVNQPPIRHGHTCASSRGPCHTLSTPFYRDLEPGPSFPGYAHAACEYRYCSNGHTLQYYERISAIAIQHRRPISCILLSPPSRSCGAAGGIKVATTRRSQLAWTSLSELGGPVEWRNEWQFSSSRAPPPIYDLTPFPADGIGRHTNPHHEVRR